MEASARASASILTDRIGLPWATASWRRFVAVSTAAAVIAYAAAVALPRYFLASELRREIQRLAVRTEQGSEDTTPVEPSSPAQTRKGSEQFIEPPDLLPAATAAGRRAGLQLAAAKQLPLQAGSDRTRRVRLQATASFEQIIGFLEEVVAMSPMPRIDALNILRPPALDVGPVKLDVDCTLSLGSPTPAQAASTLPERPK